MSPQNRRAHERYNIHLSAEIFTGTSRFTATTRDLSVGGSCVEGGYPFEEGSEVDVSLFVVVDGIEDDATPPLRTRGVVQWTAENEDAPANARHLAGLRFDHLTEAQHAWLEAVISRG
ncbi:MAG TPA: PilZ domain-containing protein [Kofleriaceae bacterium]|nr:PilZ domain-containing protein [Kofleriaceae bacterium]